jgi:hypothetical protein
MNTITCIANNGSNGQPEVPLWLCPCRTCTKLDWQALGDDRPTLAQHRHDGFPEVWDANGRAIACRMLWDCECRECRALARALNMGVAR